GHDAAALFELKRAAETDPKDPLPHLLASIIHLDRIEPGLAMSEAQEALTRIPYLKSLNQVADNQKGVANVGAPLAFMGLEEWARSAAYESYLPLWGGSHLFLADRYSGDFDKRSELMQGFIADPLAFGGSNRFQSLVSEPGHFATASYHFARSNDARISEPVLTLNGSGASPFPTAYYAEAIDTRIEPGDSPISAKGRTYTLAGGAKPTYEVGTFVYANHLSIDADLGERGVTGDFQRISGTTSRVDAGVRFAPDSRSAIWLKGGLFREDATDDDTQRIVLPDSSIVRDSHFHFKPEAKDLALRHTFVASDRFEWTWGVEEARGKTPSFLSRDADVHFDGQPADTQTLDETDRDRSRTAYALARIGNRDL